MKKGKKIFLVIVITLGIIVLLNILYLLYAFGFFHFLVYDHQLKSALAEGDVSVCEEFGDKGAPEYGYLRDKCYHLYALELKDPALCDQITLRGRSIPTKDICYESLASITNNPSLCEKLYNKDNINNCKSRVRTNLSDIKDIRV